MSTEKDAAPLPTDKNNDAGKTAQQLDDEHINELIAKGYMNESSLGGCSAAGCSCKQYQGHSVGEICNNCGHSYDHHDRNITAPPPGGR